MRYNFKKGDKLRVISGGNCYFNVGDIVTSFEDIFTNEPKKSIHILIDNDNFRKSGMWEVERFKLHKPKQKLIENKKMNAEDLNRVDKKILAAAKEEVEKERAEKQQKEAEEFLRQLYAEKDDAEAVVKASGIDLKEINKKLKVFDVK